MPYLVVDNLTIRPLNAFRGFKPAPGQEPENNVQLDVSALAYPEPRAGAGGRRSEGGCPDERRCHRRCAAGSSGWLPFAVLALLIGWQTDWGRALRRVPPPKTAVAPQPVTVVAAAGVPAGRHARRRAATSSSARCSIRRAGRRPRPCAEAAKPQMQRGQFALTGTLMVDGKATAFLREINGGKSRRVAQGERSTAWCVAEVRPTACG